MLLQYRTRVSRVLVAACRAFSTDTSLPRAPHFSPKFWDEHSAQYEGSFFEFYTKGIAPKLVDLVQLGSPKRILDVGCGTGQLTFLAAAAYPNAEIVATDISEAMVTRLQEKLDGGRFPNVRVQQANGETLEGLEDGSFDAVFSNLAIMFFPDRKKGYGAMHRVLRTGGVACVSAWGPIPQNPAITALVNSLDVVRVKNNEDAVAKGKELSALDKTPVPNRPNPNFSLASGEFFRQEMAEVGFKEVTVRPVKHHFTGHVDELADMAVRSVSTTVPPQHIQAFKDAFVEKAQNMMKLLNAKATVNVCVARK